MNPELAEDVLDVRIDRALGQYQLFGDFTVPEALGHQLGDLPLPPGQRVGGDLVGRDRHLVPGHRDRLGYGQLQATLTVALEPLVAQRLPAGFRGAPPDLGVIRALLDGRAQHLPERVAGPA